MKPAPFDFAFRQSETLQKRFDYSLNFQHSTANYAFKILKPVVKGFLFVEIYTDTGILRYLNVLFTRNYISMNVPIFVVEEILWDKCVQICN